MNQRVSSEPSIETPGTTMSGAMPPVNCVSGLNRLLIRAVRALGTAGRTELARHIASEAWTALLKQRPEEADRLNGALHDLTRRRRRRRRLVASSVSRQLDFRHLPPAQRDALMLDTCEKLTPDRAVILVNDYDPKPLHDKLELEHPGSLIWEYIESGPDVWQIRVLRKR